MGDIRPFLLYQEARTQSRGCSSFCSSIVLIFIVITTTSMTLGCILTDCDQVIDQVGVCMFFDNTNFSVMCFKILLQN